MSNRSRFLLFASLALGFVASARAELSWTQKTVELDADARSTVLEAKFHFTNTGRSPVDIRQIESSCGCTTAELKERHYEPGASGDIVARYTVGAMHVGLQSKTIAVSTSDRTDPTMLTLNVHVPEILRITPNFVTWKHGEEVKTKSITLELIPAPPIDEITVQSSHAGMNVTLETLTKGRKYRLDITPVATRELIFATLYVHCRYGEEDRTFRVYATVKPPNSDPQ